jgi:short-subunit dehydrogenase
VEFVVIDLADANSVRRCAADVLKRHSRIDILVNAAGCNDIQPFMEKPARLEQ